MYVDRCFPSMVPTAILDENTSSMKQTIPSYHEAHKQIVDPAHNVCLFSLQLSKHANTMIPNSIPIPNAIRSSLPHSPPNHSVSLDPSANPLQPPKNNPENLPTPNQIQNPQPLIIQMRSITRLTTGQMRRRRPKLLLQEPDRRN